MEGLKTVQRRQGDVVQLHVELSTFQSQMLEQYAKQFGQTKTDIIASALNIWFAMVERKPEVK